MIPDKKLTGRSQLTTFFDRADLDMDHIDLQLNSLDKDLCDSRQKAYFVKSFMKI